jgi:hypothetical protein
MFPVRMQLYLQFFFKKTQIHGMWPLTPSSASSFVVVMWPLDRFLSPLIFQ